MEKFDLENTSKLSGKTDCVEFSDYARNLLLDHLQLVLEYNKKINLTAIKDLEQGKILHIEDSLAPLHYMLCEINQNLDDTQRNCLNYIDIGSGAGFPGIPISIVTWWDTTLIETTTKKCMALEYFIDELDIENVSVLNSRIEKASKENYGMYNVVSARALSSINSLLELASPLLQINGLLFCYKGGTCDEEIKQASEIEDTVGMRYVKTYSYKLSDGTDRKLVVYKKDHKERISLPRKEGFAQKKPLKF